MAPIKPASTFAISSPLCAWPSAARWTSSLPFIATALPPYLEALTPVSYEACCGRCASAFCPYHEGARWTGVAAVTLSMTTLRYVRG